MPAQSKMRDLGYNLVRSHITTEFYDLDLKALGIHVLVFEP